MPDNYRRFLISCGCGFDSEVCRDAQISPLKSILNKLHMGKLIYTLVALKKFIFKSTFAAKFIIDGKLDFLTVNNLTRIQIIPLLPKAKKGKHKGYPGIDITPVSKVDMRFSKSVFLHTDGEVLGSFKHVQIICAKKHIKFYLP